MTNEEDGVTHSELHKSNVKRRGRQGTTKLIGMALGVSLCFGYRIVVRRSVRVLWNDPGDACKAAREMRRLEFFRLIRVHN